MVNGWLQVHVADTHKIQKWTMSPAFRSDWQKSPGCNWLYKPIVRTGFSFQVDSHLQTKMIEHLFSDKILLLHFSNSNPFGWQKLLCFPFVSISKCWRKMGLNVILNLHLYIERNSLWMNDIVQCHLIAKYLDIYHIHSGDLGPFKVSLSLHAVSKVNNHETCYNIGYQHAHSMLAQWWEQSQIFPNV